MRIQAVHRAVGRGWTYLGVYRPKAGRKGETMDVVRTPTGFLYGRPVVSPDDRWTYLSEAEWGNGFVKEGEWHG